MNKDNEFVKQHIELVQRLLLFNEVNIFELLFRLFFFNK